MKAIGQPSAILLNCADDFPILQTENRHKPLIYLDSAATTQKPKLVIEATSQFYEQDYANVHRGIYELSERATKRYEDTRTQVQQFIHATYPEEIIFTSGTTASINLLAQTLSKGSADHAPWQKGDEVILSQMEHHSNIVPWYLLKQQLGIEIKVVPISDKGELDIAAYRQLFSAKTKLVAITHASNVLGTINPIQELTAIAHEHNVPILLDGAQAAPYMPINMQEIDCDFYVFSAHKLYGPTGVGVLYGKKAWLESLSPYQGGGSMISSVSFDNITFAKLPLKLEAGTPNIAGVIGLSAAIHYVEQIGMDTIYQHEQQLVAYAQPKLAEIKGLHLIGTAPHKVGVISFVMDGVHPHDIGTVLDNEGIAVRASHHCAMPLMEHYQIPAAVRASFGVYNTPSDIDALVSGLQLVNTIFR